LDGVLYGVEEDVGGGALRGERAALECLAGAQFEVHGIGAVADGAHARRAVEGVVEKDSPFEPDGGLGDHVTGTGNIACFEFFYAGKVGDSTSVIYADLLEELQVDGVVDVAVRVEVAVADLEPRRSGRVLHGCAPFGSVCRGRLYTLNRPCI
jgi:hypothetical protein